MDKAKLVELADRCEAATGPDIDLDLAISDATEAWKTAATWRQFRPTASLDAAATLVPEGHAFSLFSDGYAGVAPAHGEDMPTADCQCATPPLSLCAAALRARAKVTPDG